LKSNAKVEKVLLSKTFDGSVMETGCSKIKAARGQIQITHTSKTFVLSAGAFESPKPLTLPGIADASLLNSLGVELVLSDPDIRRIYKIKSKPGWNDEPAH
jgi:hypothetical protein